MKKLVYAVITLVLVSGIFIQNTRAQIPVTVTNPTNTTPNLAGSYGSLASALTALNSVTAMSGPVTLTLTAGNSETAPPTGLVIGSATLNPVLNSVNTVTIVSSGGTVTLNAGIGTATPSSAAPDGILAIAGADYITIDGLTFTDGNAANPATMEFGVALFKLSASDGAQYNTIQNCTINMQRINNASGTSPMVEGSVGILVINSIPTAATTVLTPASAAGTNSYNKFYANSINSGNYGIALSGYSAATPFTLGDTGNDVGGTSAGQGNMILNYGGGAATNPAAGIRANYQWGINISYNTINNNNGGGVNHATTLRGIYAQNGTSANATISYNNITIKGGGTSSQVAAIENAIGSTAASNTVNINNNTITGEYLTATSAAFYGIYSSSSAANVNITYNSVTGMSYSGAALAGSGSTYMIYNSGSTANLNASYNIVNTISRTGTTGGTLIGIYCSSGTSQTVNNNAVSTMSINGTGTSGTMYGIQTSGTTVVANNNNVNNLSNTKTTGTGALYGMYNISSPTNENYNNNTIYNLSHSGTGTTYGIYAYTTTGTRTVSFNTIYGISSGGTTVSGINMASSSPNIFKNKIYNIQSTSTGNAVVSGISVTSLGTAGTANVYNNLIGDLKAPAGTISAGTAPAVRGINLTVTTTTSTLNVHYNTVYLTASSTAANFGTAGLYVTSSATATTATLNLRDNIIVNSSTPAGTGFTVAYHRSTIDLANYGSASNNNLFYAGTPGSANLIFYDGTNSYQTLAAFKTAVGPARESSSISENPVFVSTTGSDATYLHINTSTPTQIESGGINIATYTDDYDGDIRQGNPGYAGTGTAPDVGADEFEGTPLDLTPPAISYTPLLNTSSNLDRSIRVAISDASGVPTAGDGLPVLYWTVNGGSYTAAQGVWEAGNNYNFTFGAGTYVTGDIISYYIVARDMATTPNIGAFPSAGAGGFTYDPPAAGTPPTTPSTYTILACISGTYTVGATGDYATITAAIADLNSKELCGALTFNLIDATYTTPAETFPITINYNTGSSPVNSLTIQPAASATPYIYGAAASGMIFRVLNPNTIIDGSNGSKTGRNMTIENTSTTTPQVVRIASVGTTAITNVTLKNCVIINGVTSSSAVVVYGNDGTAGWFNNITIQNNSIQKAYIGNYNLAVMSSGNGSGLLIDGNNLDATGTNAIRLVGIYVQGVDGAMVSNNTIGNIPDANAEYNRGIWFATGTVNSTISGNTISNLSYTGTSSYAPMGISLSPAVSAANITVTGNIITGITSTGTGVPMGIYAFSAATGMTIQNNKISNVKNSNSGGYSAAGIALGSTMTSANMTVANNFIWDVAGYGWVSTTTDNGYGIAVQSGGGYNIYFNSINLATNQTVDGNPACIIIASGLPDGSLDIRNNIFSIPATMGTDRYAVICNSANTVFSNINYNDYYSTGPNLGYIGAANQVDLAAWRTGTGQDLNSTSGDPGYLTPTDLHINLSFPTPVSDAGFYIPSVPTDIDGETRLNPPDIGADEFTLVLCSGPAIGGTASAPITSFCGPVTSPVITASGYSTGIGSSYQWQFFEEEGGTWVDIGGQTNPTALTTGLISFTTQYRLKVTCNAGTPDYSTSVTITILAVPTATASSNSPVCTGNTLDLTGTSDGVSFSWTGPNGFTSALQNPSIPSVTLAASGLYSFTATAANGCTTNSTTTVTVNLTPVLNSVTATPPAVCYNGSTQLQANATPIPTDVAAYSFVPSSGTWTQLAGGTNVTAIQSDDSYAGPFPLGFTFNYCGTGYTQFWVSSNGILTFGTLASSYASNGLASAASTILPLVAPLWDDLDGNTSQSPTSYASYLTSGTAGNQVFTFEWRDWQWYYSSNVATISFQVKLYEADGHIDFVYNPVAAPVVTGSASIGLAGPTTGKYLSLNGTGPSPSASSTVETTTLSTNPAAGQTYSFYPPPTLTYAWSPTTNLSNPNIANPVASNITATTTYNVTVTYGSCSATGSVEVTTGEALSALASADPAIPVCAGTPVTLAATPVGGGGPYTYLWSNGSTLGTFIDAPLSTTTYYVTVYDNCGANATSSVTVNVKPVPTSGASSNSPLCTGATLELSGTTDIGVSFSWTGPDGFASALQNPTLPSVTLAANGDYLFTATFDGCTSTTATAPVTVYLTPGAVSITPPAPLVPFGAIQSLTASGGDVSGITILSENFNNDAPAWTITNNGTAGTGFYYQTCPFSYNPSSYYNNFCTNDGVKFAISNSDVGGSGSSTNTTLASPAFSTVGFTSATLTFEQSFHSWSSDTKVAVEISSDGGTTWDPTPLVSYLGVTQGSYTETAPASVPFPPAYLGQTNLKIRFNYVSTWGYFWVIDDVRITGSGSAAFTWSPDTELFTDPGATTPYVLGTQTPTVYTKPTADITYTATATNSTGGCTRSQNVFVTSLCGDAIAPFEEDFELLDFPPLCWANYAVTETYTWARSTDASGYGTGTASAFADFYDQPSGTYELRSRPFDMTGLTSPKLHFDWAYAAFYSGATVEAMNVFYSTDHGNSWTLLLNMPGGETGILNTGGMVTIPFIPAANQWGSQDLALPTGTNMVKFQAISEAGNNLYLDNVRVIAAPAVTTEAADNITTSGATLHGTVDANLAGTTVTFEYGTSTLYGTTLSAVPGTVTGHTPTAVSLPIAGLAENTEYHFRVVGVNSCGTVNGSDLTFTTAAGVPLNYTLTGESGPGLVCYNAQQILTVGGTPPNNYTALSGADVTLIAGEKVVFNPDSKVNLGGKLHAYIAPGGPWCNPVKITEVTAVTEVKVPAVESANFTLYPNPTNGNFILVQKGSRTFGSVKVDVYSMSGEKVMTERMIAEKKHEFGFSDIPAGIYFVKVIADDYVETIKLIKTR